MINAELAAKIRIQPAYQLRCEADLWQQQERLFAVGNAFANFLDIEQGFAGAGGRLAAGQTPFAERPACSAS